MKITPHQAEKIFKGNPTFSQLGFSMMITRLKTNYNKNPSPAAVHSFTEEINEFLAKFQPIMNKDYEIIKQL